MNVDNLLTNNHFISSNSQSISFVYTIYTRKFYLSSMWNDKYMLNEYLSGNLLNKKNRSKLVSQVT